MAREVNIDNRRFYIVSEPDQGVWKAQVLEIVNESGSTSDMGIETTGETRTLADDRAFAVLQNRLRK